MLFARILKTTIWH